MMQAPQSRPAAWRRWLPLGVLLALMAVSYAMGWHKYLSLQTVGLHYEALQTFIARHLPAAIVIYILAYVALVALSLPGALFMTLAGGLLLGWKIAVPAIVVGATAGASIIYLIARTSLGEHFAAQAGPWLGRLKAGFQENALSYLLFLRLVPVFPFVIVNLAAALLGVPFRTYVIGTFLGIIPATTAYAVAASGLGSVIEAQNRVHQACLAKGPAEPATACPYTIDTSALVTRELVAAFVLLGLVALIPVAFKKWSKRNATA